MFEHINYIINCTQESFQPLFLGRPARVRLAELGMHDILVAEVLLANKQKTYCCCSENTLLIIHSTNNWPTQAI